MRYFWLTKLADSTHTYLKRLEKGSNGQDAVRRELRKLPSGYTFLNDFNYTNQNSTDIVVIGPTGVFTIEVKNYHNRKITYQNDILMGDGKSFPKNVLHQAYEEMKTLQKYLALTENITLPVHPVLVFANPRTIVHFGLNPIRGVYVVGLSWLRKAILEQPQIFTQEQCAALRKDIEKHTNYL